jgi:mycothione reductase
VTHYDVIVLGAGSGNGIIDEEFAEGRRCALVQSGAFGGTCLNVGCIPTKMFVYPADLARAARSEGARLGISTTFEQADWPAIRDRIFGRIDAIEAAGRGYRTTSPLADCYLGHARFIGPHQIEISGDDGTVMVITGDQIVVAVGGRPSIPEISGLAEVNYHTSDTIMRLAQLPERVGILGGGYIGSEFSHVFSALGSHVIQIHRHPVLLNHHDHDIAARFTELAGEQWELRLRSQLVAVTQSSSGIQLQIFGEDESEGSAKMDTEVDVLLIAAGRRPNTDLLNLPAAGISTTARGFIPVDEYQRSTVPHIWALGDVCDTPELKHVANHEARVVQHNLLRPSNLMAADHRFVPAAVFSHPQVASVGLTEAEARAAGHDVAIKIQALGDTAYGWAMEDQQHFVKLLGDRTTKRLLGAHIIGPHAGSLIQPLIQAMSFEQPVPGLARGQYWIHPAMAEVVENALLGLEAELG